MWHIGDSLAARIDTIELETLSLAEIRRSHPNLAIEEAIFRGGEPELYNNLNLKESRFYSGYIASY